MALRRFLLKHVIDLRFDKVVIKGNFHWVSFYCLPEELKGAIESHPLGDRAFLDNEALEEICDDLEIDFGDSAPYDETIWTDPNNDLYAYQELPNNIYSCKASLLASESITLQTNDGKILEKLSFLNVKRYDKKCEVNIPERFANKGYALLVVCSNREDCIVEHDLQGIPEKHFNSSCLGFNVFTFKQSIFPLVGSVSYDHRPLKSRLAFKGIINQPAPDNTLYDVFYDHSYGHTFEWFEI